MGPGPRVSRRTTIRWILAASAVMPAMPRIAFAGNPAPTTPAATGYGTDPDLLRVYRPGDVWPLVLSDGERRVVADLADLVIPEDAHSPSASAVGIVDFLDEWLSAPYPAQQADLELLRSGLAWLEAESVRRFGRGFAALDETAKAAICDEICYAPAAPEHLKPAATFFARFRDLTAGGFYTTPAGMRDIRYVGNVALPRFDGPPPEVLRRVGLAPAEDGEPT